MAPWFPPSGSAPVLDVSHQIALIFFKLHLPEISQQITSIFRYTIKVIPEESLFTTLHWYFLYNYSLFEENLILYYIIMHV